MYAKKTLYAYMPCAGLEGTEYIDRVVATFYKKSYAAALRDFVTDPENIWCPKWIKRNYEIYNKLSYDATGPAFRDEEHPPLPGPPDPAVPPPDAPTPRFPNPGGHTTRYVFQTGEPEHDPALADPEPDPAKVPKPHDPWGTANRTQWQLHSALGPNVGAEGRTSQAPPVPMAELVNPVNPSLPYDRHWQDHSKSCSMKTWEVLETTSNRYSDETLSRETLGDDYQQLFVTLVLDHARYIIDCVGRGVQPEPMRLLLLGTAGSGKTRAVRTALQELQRALAAAEMPVEIDPATFVRVGAPTGTAAFNLRFNATTVHRLIHWFKPPFSRS